MHPIQVPAGIQEAQEQCERIQSAHQAEQAVEKEAATQWSYAAEQAAITSQCESFAPTTHVKDLTVRSNPLTVSVEYTSAHYIGSV